MSAQRYELDSFKFVAHSPRDIINPKFQILWSIQHKQHSSQMKLSCNFLRCGSLHQLIMVIRDSLQTNLMIKSKNNLQHFITSLLQLIRQAQQIYTNKLSMATISDLYSLQSSLSTGGIEGYHVEKKYIDPMKMKQERIISQSKSKYQGAKPVNVSKKTSFIDQVQKKQAKLPGPFTYEQQIKQKVRNNGDVVKHADRKTFIDEIAQIQKKKHVPGAGSYGKIQTDVDKTRLRSNLSKAQTPTYLEASMRNSLDCPGVGNYNSYRVELDHRGSKWVADPEKGKKKSVQKLPPVGTYTPNPVQYSLFASISDTQKRKFSAGMGGKSERFKTSKQKKLPFYNILSEWGMKNKLQKKDIMSQISSHPSASRSLYY